MTARGVLRIPVGAGDQGRRHARLTIGTAARRRRPRSSSPPGSGRPSGNARSPSRSWSGPFAIDHGRPRATVDSAPVELTATEYELLRVLSLDAGRVVDFETLPRPVWPKRENAGANLVRIFVRNLGDSADSPAYIFNQLGLVVLRCFVWLDRAVDLLEQICRFESCGVDLLA